VSISKSATDYTSAVKQVTDTNPDAVYFAGISDDGTTFVKALRIAKPGLPIVASDRVFTQNFVSKTEGKAEGVYVTCPCIPSKRAGADFASKYQGAYSAQSSYYGPEAYDATATFLAGFTAGKGARADMLKFLGTYSGKGPATGRTVKFDGSGNLDATDPQIWAYKVQGEYMVDQAVIAP
jgi:branched-chain amino acid transport system substrate-binding protein